MNHIIENIAKNVGADSTLDHYFRYSPHLESNDLFEILNFFDKLRQHLNHQSFDIYCSSNMGDEITMDMYAEITQQGNTPHLFFTVQFGSVETGLTFSSRKELDGRDKILAYIDSF